ncbi:alpha/beta fold hydrolase [Catenulispora rubra]|uniref:alpha/beta fold hydrolase n=1 Tax=Catenulispora rubra TaxID=280293 RepID=UPI001E3269BB|nr:hypothetical protein [Catenulispora rubra]
MPFTMSNGVRLAYDEAGAGPAVVLTHGGLGDRRMWDHQFQALAEGCRVDAVWAARSWLTRSGCSAWGEWLLSTDYSSAVIGAVVEWVRLRSDGAKGGDRCGHEEGHRLELTTCVAFVFAGPRRFAARRGPVFLRAQ